MNPQNKTAENSAEDWVDRYVYAVTRQLPRNRREDIAREMHSAIEDALEARCQNEPVRESDVFAVLENLGSPTVLARQYLPADRQALIPSPYYQSYLFIRRVVLFASGGGLALAMVLQAFLADHYTLGDFFANLAALGSALLCAYAAVTLLFSFLSRRGIDLRLKEEDIKNLPPVPARQKTISRRNTVGCILLCILFVLLLLAFPSIMVFPNAGGGSLPLFDISVLHSMWPLILLFAILGIFRESVKYIDGAYTRRVVVVSVVVDALSLVLAGVILLSMPIMNAQLDYSVSSLFAGEGQALSPFFLHFNLFFFAFIAFALILDGITALLRRRA